MFLIPGLKMLMGSVWPSSDKSSCQMKKSKLDVATKKTFLELTFLECKCNLVRTNVNKSEALLCWSTCLLMILQLTILSPKVGSITGS